MGRVKFTPWRVGGLVAGVAAFALLLALDSPLHRVEGKGSQPAFAAAVTALMAIWWLTEALPIWLTALVPMALFPVLSPFDGGFGDAVLETTLPYVHPFNFLFFGGMCIAAAMMQCGLHRRLALNIMRVVGTDPCRLLLGFLVATSFVSMWISNTATATMMMPIGLAVIAQFEERQGGARLVHYGAAIMLSIAYAANVGGIATTIGTAPNAIFAGVMAKQGIVISFPKFMAVGLPFVLLFLPVVWWAVWRVGRHDAPPEHVGAAALESELAKLGRMSRAERVVLATFVTTALLWIASKWVSDELKPLVGPWFKSVGVKFTGNHFDAFLGLVAAASLLVARADGRRTLEFATIRKIPWGTLLLLGGSFSMAAGIEDSGLGKWLGEGLSFLRDVAPFWQILAASVATVALSAVASNTATINVMLTVLRGAVSPAHMTTVLFASTISSSCDFALPAGTPPNAIVFGSGYVTVPRMAKTGVLLDVAAAILAGVWCWLVVRWVVGT